jgi:HAMP domain-containing protein
MERSSETSLPDDQDSLGPDAGSGPTPSELQERLWGLGDAAQTGFGGKALFRAVPPSLRAGQDEPESPNPEEVDAGALASTVGTLARQLERSVRRLLALENRVSEGLAAVEARIGDAPGGDGSTLQDLTPLERALSEEVASLGERLAEPAAQLAARVDTLEDLVAGTGGLVERVAGSPAGPAGPSPTAERALARADELDRRLGELEKSHAGLAGTVERSSREVVNRLTRKIEDLRDDVSVQMAEARRTAAAEAAQPPAIPALVERLRAAEHAFSERARAVVQGLAESATGPAVAHLHAFRGAVTELLGLHREVRQTVEALNPPPTPPAPASEPEPGS